jgi:amidohydrolase
MMIHPSPEDVVDPAFLAVAHLDIDFYGKESHAAFAPQVGINALDAAVQAYVNISTLRQTLYNTDKVHGVITHGGGAPNVIPQHTSLAFYVRAATMSRLDALRKKVEACFEAAALATGCSVEIKPRGHTYTEMHNDPVMVKLFAANSDTLGRRMGSAAGHDPGAAGSTDMANVSRIVPTIHPMLGINSAPSVNHQREFAAHTVTPDGERAIRDGAIAMAWTVVDLATANRWSELGAALPR